MARALAQFVADNGVLPLRGSIPDMHADTDAYVTLQQVCYRRPRAKCRMCTCIYACMCVFSVHMCACV